MSTLRAHGRAAAAYGQVQHAAIGGRAAEAEAFAMAAAYLRDARTRPSDRVLLARALGFNQKLWTIIQAEVSDRGHPAPEDVRGDMMSLARFMDQATADALAAQAPRLDTMIAINSSLAAGMFSRPS
jgi:flagellar protein FlaF